MSLARIRTSELRLMRHMTQAILAERAHLSKTTISNLESGLQTKIGLNTIAKLCQALDCSPSDLFELEDSHAQDLLKQQRAALAPFIGSLEYSLEFEPSRLDKELAKLTHLKKARRKL
jgi:putative transcriptional regulator